MTTIATGQGVPGADSTDQVTNALIREATQLIGKRHADHH
jgi:hypothetical protein